MTTPPPSGQEPPYRSTAYGQQPVVPYLDSPPAPRVSAGRLWAGGLMTAVVAALAAVVCTLLVRGVLQISVFAPEGNGVFGDASTGALAGGAFAAALAATLVLHLLIIAVPQPGRFFRWIVGLATAAMVLLPFTTPVELSAKCGTAAIYLAIGLTIGSLLSAVARSAATGGQP